MSKKTLSLGPRKGSGNGSPRRNKIRVNTLTPPKDLPEQPPERVATGNPVPKSAYPAEPSITSRREKRSMENRQRDILGVQQQMGYGEPADFEGAASSGDVIMASRFSNMGDGSALKAIGAKVATNHPLTGGEEDIYNKVASVGNANNIINQMSSKISAGATAGPEMEEGQSTYEEQMGFDGITDYSNKDNGPSIDGMVGRVNKGDTDINPQIQGHAEFSDIDKEFKSSGGEWLPEMYNTLAATYANQEDPQSEMNTAALSKRFQSELPAVMQEMGPVFAAQGDNNKQRKANGLPEVSRGWGQALDLMGVSQGDPKKDKEAFRARGKIVKEMAGIMNLSGLQKGYRRENEMGLGRPRSVEGDMGHVLDEVATISNMDKEFDSREIDGEVVVDSEFSENLNEAIGGGHTGDGSFVNASHFNEVNERLSDRLGLDVADSPMTRMMTAATKAANPTSSIAAGLKRLNQDVLDKEELDGDEWIKGLVPDSKEAVSHTLESRLMDDGISISGAEQGTDEWKSERIPLTTAADAKQAKTGKLDKVGERMGVPQDEVIKNPNMDRGTRREPKIADWYAKEYGVELSEGGMLTNQTYKGLGASLDRYVTGGEDVGEQITRGVEIKSVGQFRNKADFNDQIQMQMALSGMNEMDLVQERMDYDHPNEDGSPKIDYQVDRIAASDSWQRRELPKIEAQQKAMEESAQILSTAGDMAEAGSSDKEISGYLKDSIKEAHYELVWENAPALGDRVATLAEDAVTGNQEAEAAAVATENQRVLTNASRRAGAISALQQGLKTGTVEGLADGGVNAVRAMGPVGETVAGVVDAGKVAYNAMDITRTASNQGFSVGVTGSSFQHNLQDLMSGGVSKSNASQFIATAEGASADMSIGNYDGALKIVEGSRGLLTFEDVMNNDAEGLKEVFASRAKDANLSTKEIAGMERATGLAGMTSAVSEAPEAVALRKAAAALEATNLNMKTLIAVLDAAGGAEEIEEEPTNSTQGVPKSVLSFTGKGPGKTKPDRQIPSSVLSFTKGAEGAKMNGIVDPGAAKPSHSINYHDNPLKVLVELTNRMTSVKTTAPDGTITHEKQLNNSQNNVNY